MPLKDNNDKKVKKLFDEYLSDISASENSEAYLKSEGLDPDKLVNDGLRRVKQLKMKMASSRTETTFSVLTNTLMENAKEEARKLIDAVNFDFAAFVKKEGITVAYRNLENLSKEEIREFLEKHILLKLQQQNENNSKG
jgi:hypothetical protein